MNRFQIRPIAANVSLDDFTSMGLQGIFGAWAPAFDLRGSGPGHHQRGSKQRATMPGTHCGNIAAKSQPEGGDCLTIELAGEHASDLPAVALELLQGSPT